MTKDLKNAASPTSPDQHGVGWVLAGIAVGLLTSAAVYATATLSNGSPDLSSVKPGARQTASNAATSHEKQTTENSRPNFSYHAVLPQL